MCRIAGIVDNRRYQDQLINEVDFMVKSMIHGGPDANGIYSNKEFAFGHCRLSIIDLSESASQPMLDKVSGNVISFNGEIYNYKEIKSELLKLNHEFSTNSDTEVILKAYNQWGVKSFGKFNGMFAFSLYDKKKNLVYLVRDPNGIKLLYYSTTNDQLIFASEIKAFKGIVDDEFEEWKVLFLTYGFIPEPYTKIKDVLSLDVSSYLEYDILSKKHITRKYNYSIDSNDTYQFRNYDDLKIRLIESVDRHLISDASIGVFLSGGIDSSLLSILASLSIECVNTLSINFTESEYTEKKYQDLIVKLIESKHFEYQLNEIDFDLSIERIYASYDSPSNDGINTWFISKFASENGIKAVLSGLGADELFGGYPSFNRYKYLKFLHLSNGLIKIGSRLLNRNYLRLEFLNVDEDIADYLLLRGFYTPSEVSKILGLSVQDVIYILNNFKPNASRRVESIEDISFLETNMYMRNQLLRDSDVMSMRHGVEIRVPLLDNEFLHFVRNIKPEILYNEPGKKSLLINSFADTLPEQIWNRPKKGFQFPFKLWMKKSEFVRSKMDGQMKNKQFELFIKDKLHWSKIWTLAQIN